MADAEERRGGAIAMTATMSREEQSVADDVFSFKLPPRPFPGLRPFGKDEWPIFFGRERMIDEVIERLIRHRFLVVHGDSGCGKSSLIRAGVLPRLEQESARNGLRWRTCATTPGGEPQARLAEALAALAANDFERRKLDIRRFLNCGRAGAARLSEYIARDCQDHVCLLIDQFEEIFAHARRRGPQQAAALIELLIGLQKQASSRLCIVLTMRSEFLGACAQFEGFAQTVNTTQYLLPRMEHADLIRAIREPAPLYDGEVAADLAARLIADAGVSPDQLPLIQHALMVLHRDCTKGAEGPWRLTLDQYLVPGRLRQLLSDHADEIARGVEGQVQTAAQSGPGLQISASAPASPPMSDAAAREANSRVVEDIFRALTETNAEGVAIRRPQRLSDLIAVTGASEAAVRRVVDAFRAEGASFLSPYHVEPIKLDDYVDISHEALIRCWERIADKSDGWLIREFKNGLVWRSLLVQADSFERDPSNVLSPATTQERQTWLARRNSAWSDRYGSGWDRVQKLIEASVEERERQMRAEIEERSREAQAKLEAEETKYREQRLKANLAIAEEKSRREKLFRRAFVVAAVLASSAAYFAYAAYQDRGLAIKDRAIAERETAKAQLAGEALQQAFNEAEQKRKSAEAHLANINDQLGTLKTASAAAPVNSSLKQSIDLAQISIALQVAALSNVARLKPRIYIQIAEESQREPARELELRIEAGRSGDAEVVVPGIQLINSAPPYSLLRCFVAQDCEQYGPRLLALVREQLISPRVELQDFSRSYTPSSAKVMRPQHFELYFARGPITLAPRAEVPKAPVGPPKQ